MNRIELYKLSVGEKIKFYRELCNMTQVDLANKSEIPIGTLQKYEIDSRNPKPEPLFKIAKALKCSVYDLTNIECDSEEDVIAIISQPQVRKYLNSAIKKLQKEIDEEIDYYSSLVNDLEITREEIADLEFIEKE